MNKDLLDLYTDYLICSSEQTTATQLSRMLDGHVSHDQVTRFLSSQSFTDKDLWKLVKPTLRSIESEEHGVLIFDDTIIEKQWTDENEIICYHFDHSKGRSVKGINLLNLIYHHNGISLPLSFHIVKKPISYCDLHTRQIKRESMVSKNEMLHQMFMQMIANAVKFKYVLFDSWYSSKETFDLIRKKRKHFISALKSNRLIALSEKDKRNGRFQQVREIGLKDGEIVRGWLKGYSHEVLICRQVFTNKDGSTSSLDLVCSDLSLDGNDITRIYQKRWNIEVYHKSLKSNACISKSPTRTVRTQSNHLFLSICSVLKLEQLKIHHKMNHFALKAKIYLNSLKAAYAEISCFKKAAA